MAGYNIEIIIIAILASALAGVAGILVWIGARDLVRRVVKLEETSSQHVKEQGELQRKLENMQEQLAELQNRRRLPNAASIAVDDALAIALDVMQEDEALHQYRSARVHQLMDVMQRMRANPHHYEELKNQKVSYEHRKR
jgi:flagellar basal body-associated protein FliL